MARPLKFTDPLALAEKIEKYFEMMQPDPEKPDDPGRPPTLSGLALFLGTTRKTLGEYIADAERGEGKKSGREKECAELIMMAKAQIECYLEERLITNYSRGLEFTLQNGYHGWGVKNNVEVKGDVEVDHKGEVKTAAASLSDEELLERMKVLAARQAEIMAREGLVDGADG